MQRGCAILFDIALNGATTSKKQIKPFTAEKDHANIAKLGWVALASWLKQDRCFPDPATHSRHPALQLVGLDQLGLLEPPPYGFMVWYTTHSHPSLAPRDTFQRYRSS